MDSCRCPTCLSFNPPEAYSCAECGERLSGGRRRRWRWIAGGLMAAALGVGGVLAGIRWPAPGTPSAAPAGGGELQGLAGTLTADSGVKEPAGRPADPVLHPTGETGAESPTGPTRPSPALASPPHVPVAVVDDLGRVLRRGQGVHLGAGNLLVWLDLIRGGSGVRCGPFGEAAFVSGLAGELVLLQVPGLLHQPSCLLTPAPETGLPLLLVELPETGPAAGLHVTAQGEALEQGSGARRILYAPASITQAGRPLVTTAGALAGLVLGISTGGVGLAAPVDGLAPLLDAGLAWTFEQLRLQTHETVASSRADLGRIYVRLGDHDRALREITAAIDLDPTLAAPFLALRVRLYRAEAARLLERDRSAEARRHLEEAIALKPDDVATRRDLGLVLLAMGDPDAALAELLYVARLGPQAEREVRAELLRAYREAASASRARGDDQGALSLLRQATAVYPTDGRLKLALADSLAEAGSWGEALAAYEEVTRLDPALEAVARAGISRARRTLEGGGSVEITFPKGGTAIRTTARLDRRIEIPVIVDTGASMTVITRSVAERLGIKDLTGRRTVEVHTVGNGKMAAPVVTLESLALGAAVLHDVDVLVVDLPDWESTEGLIGLNFLNHFEFKLDHQAGRLTLTPR